MNANQWAFSAITGFEPNMPFRSAEVDGWQEMSAADLGEQAEAQVENYLPDDVDATGFDAAVVAKAVEAAQKAECSNDMYKAYTSIAD